MKRISANFGYSMQIFQVRPVGPIFGQLFSGIPDFCWVLWVLHRDPIPSKCSRKTLNFSQLFILRQVCGRSLSCLLLHLYPVSLFVCVVCGMLGFIGLDFFEPWSGSALFVDGSRYIFLFLGNCCYFLLILMMLPGKHLPTTSRNSYGGLEPQVTKDRGSFGGNL